MGVLGVQLGVRTETCCPRPQGGGRGEPGGGVEKGGRRREGAACGGGGVGGGARGVSGTTRGHLIEVPGGMEYVV